jgi:hypothetical protein
VPLTRQELPLASVEQRNFIRGLNAASPIVAQPKGTIPRVSNLVLTKRGGLRLCDGSLILSSYLGNPPTPGVQGPWLDLYLYAPNQVTRYLVGLQTAKGSTYQLKDVNPATVQINGVPGGNLGLPLSLAAWTPNTAYQGSSGPLGFHSVIQPAGVGSLPPTVAANVTPTQNLSSASPWTIVAGVTNSSWTSNWAQTLFHSFWLYMTGFGFNVAPSANISYVTVTINYTIVPAWPQGDTTSLPQMWIGFLKNGQPFGPLFYESTPSIGISGSRTFTQTTGWSPADLNNANFGVYMAWANGADVYPFTDRTITITGVSVTIPVGTSYFVCIQTGVSGATQPNWASAGQVGDEISDGSVIWVNSYPPLEYFWIITVVDAFGGQTSGISIRPPDFTPPNGPPANWHPGNLAQLSWAPVGGAAGYNVWRCRAGGNFAQFAGSTNVPSFTDNVPDSQLGVIHFTSNPNTSSYATVFWKIPEGSYTDQGSPNDVLNIFPPAYLPPLGWSLGQGGGSTGAGGAGAGVTSCGGILGAVGPLPQMLQFTNQIVMCLGNGIAPYSYPDPSLFVPFPPGGTVPPIDLTLNNGPIENNFVPAYPAWGAQISYSVGDIVQPAVGGNPSVPGSGNPGNYAFTVVQSGISAQTDPDWNNAQVIGRRINDANVIWQNTGVPSVLAPRGAAHGVVYAGSLWLANTYPYTTADNQDGPTVLKMSDVNTLLSWNPLNVAFVGRDDGTQITGLATYSIAESGIAPIGSLVVFKEFETYQVIGVFGALDFSIQKAQTDMGCVAPRSIQFLPGYGLARLTHLGIAIFDGVRDRVISEEIRPYLFGGEPDIAQVDWSFAYLSKGTQTATPPMYVLAVPRMEQGSPPPVSFTAPSVVYNTNVTSPLGSGTYWFIYTAVVNGQDVAVSAETTLTIPTQWNKLFTLTVTVNIFEIVTIPGVTAWRVYWGSAQGAENQYVEVTIIADGNTAVTITQFGTPGAPGTQHGGLTRILAYDLVLKGWTVIDLPWPVEVVKQVRAISSPPVTITGGFNDGSVRRIQAGDPDWDGLPISFSVRTPEVYGKTANQPVFYRRLSIRGQFLNYSSNMPPYPPPNFAINLVINYDGSNRQQLPGQFFMLGGGNFELRLELGDLRRTAHIDLTGIASHINLPVEIHEFSWEVQPRAQGTPPWI